MACLLLRCVAPMQSWGSRSRFQHRDTEREPTKISYRAYLADADFLVGLAGDLTLLQTIQLALRNPRWPLFLGRKAFVPGSPIYLPNGLQTEQSLEEALQTYPSIALQPTTPPFRLILECVPNENGHEQRQDIPLDFRPEHRRFAYRPVIVKTLLTLPPAKDGEICT